MLDFSLGKLLQLLDQIGNSKYEIDTFNNYLSRKDNKCLILRHDVDKEPERALEIAKYEQIRGIKGSYYFRSMKNGFPKSEIKSIAELGHEVGYHYEDLNSEKGDISKAVESFKNNLSDIRKIANVTTICMHGSPMFKYDNRDMWKKISYRELGIIGEPYFDIDFSKVMYLTDTGRRWDGSRVSIRDRVDRSQESGVSREEEDRRQKVEDSRGEEDGRQKTEDRKDMAKKRPRLHSTQDIINALRNNELPDQIMLTIHPQRWTDEWGPWVWELVSQKVKNIVKYFIVKSRQ